MYVIRDDIYAFCLNLIRDRATEIQYLTTHTVLILEDFLRDDHQLCTNFPKLEELTILHARSNDWEKVFRGMSARSPNLKMLFCKTDPNFLEIAHEEYWGLAGCLKISLDDLLDEGTRRNQF